MAENQRSPGANVVDVFASMGVPKPGAIGVINDELFAADRTKGADRAIHSADENLLGARAKIGRMRIRSQGRIILPSLL